MSDKSSMEQHMDAAMYGTPKVKPDEQRRYLGTFRERVSLAMTIAEVVDHQNLSAFITEITAHPDCQVILNGHIDQSDLGPYLKVASQHNVQFTIRQDTIYGINDSDYGLIVASDTAINQSPIALTKKYPDDTTTQANDADDTSKKTSWLGRLLDH